MAQVTTSRVVNAIPILRGVMEYQRSWLTADLFAGISVCLVMVPSVLANAELAGQAPVHGLYAALAGMIGYALFASSRQVITGPDAAIALLVGGAVGPLAGNDPVRAAALAGMTALIGGGLMLLAAWLRAGVVADFIAKPVLVGYLTGAALILISTQLGKLFGIPTEEHDFFPLLAEVTRRFRETHPLTIGLGACFLVLLEVLRRTSPRIPGALVVFVLALLASWLFDLAAYGVRIIGPVPRGLPALRMPLVTFSDLRELVPAAIGIAMLTFPEAVLLGRAFAARCGDDIRPNQELVALSAANFASGLFQGYSVGASQSRSTMNVMSGGKTQLVSLIAAGLLAAFLLFLTPILRPLPAVSLASILIYAGVRLIEIHEYRLLWARSRKGFWLALAVAASVLVVGVVPGILVGVIACLIYVLARLARPQDAVLQEVPGTGRFHDVGESADAGTIPGLIAYRFYAPLFFANAEFFVQRVQELVASSHRPVRWFLIDLQAVWEIDLTAADALTRLADELRKNGVSLKFARANRPLRERLGQFGLNDNVSELTYFPSVHAAVEAFQRETGNSDRAFESNSDRSGTKHDPGNMHSA